MFECILFENNITYAMVCIGTFFPLLCLKVIGKDSMFYKSRQKPFEKLVKAFVNKFFSIAISHNTVEQNVIYLRNCNEMTSKQLGT